MVPKEPPVLMAVTVAQVVQTVGMLLTTLILALELLGKVMLVVNPVQIHVQVLEVAVVLVVLVIKVMHMTVTLLSHRLLRHKVV
jgi:hypothetical protein